MKNIVLKITFIFFILYIPPSGCGYQAQEDKARELIVRCKTLALGMPRNKVIEIMGEPLNIIVDDKKKEELKEYLVFLSPRTASTFTQTVLNKKSGLVVEIICGEDYRIFINKDSIQK